MTTMMPIEPTYAAMATSPTTGRRFFRRGSDSRYTHPTDVGGAALLATTDPVHNAALEEEMDLIGSPMKVDEEDEEESGWIGEARKVWRRMSFGATKPDMKHAPAKRPEHAHADVKGKGPAPVAPVAEVHPVVLPAPAASPTASAPPATKEALSVEIPK